jgi:predicted RNA-binding protein with TRAM domain
VLIVLIDFLWPATPQRSLLKRDDLEKFIVRGRPAQQVRGDAKVEEKKTSNFHAWGVIEKITESSYQFIDDMSVWPNGPFHSFVGSVRIVKERTEPYVEPHIEDHDQIQIFLGETTKPDSLAAEITLGDQKFEVKSPFVAIYPMGMRHAEHIVSGSGWMLSVHLARRALQYGKSLVPCPVEVGKEYDVQIAELSRAGQGIARIQDFVLFVPGTKPGNRVRVRISRIGQLSAEAKAVKMSA